MVHADSTRISRVPAYSGISLPFHIYFDYRTITLFGITSQRSSSINNEKVVASPTTPYLLWFRLFPVRSPLLRKSFLLSLPVGTKMFQFSTCAPIILCIQIIGVMSLS